MTPALCAAEVIADGRFHMCGHPLPCWRHPKKCEARSAYGQCTEYAGHDVGPAATAHRSTYQWVQVREEIRLNDQSFKCNFCQLGKHDRCVESGCVCTKCMHWCRACRLHKCWDCPDRANPGTRIYCTCERPNHAKEVKAGRWVPEEPQERSEVNELPQTPSARVDPFDMTPSSGTIGTSERRALSPVLPASPPPSAARHNPGASEDSSTGVSFLDAAGRGQLGFLLNLGEDTTWENILAAVRQLKKERDQLAKEHEAIKKALEVLSNWS